MARIYVLAAYRQRKAHRLQVPAPGVARTDARVAVTRVSLPALVGEASAPTCAICGAPIVVPAGAEPGEARLMLAGLLAEGLCASCYAPF